MPKSILYIFILFTTNAYSETSRDFAQRVGEKMQISQQDAEVLLEKVFDSLSEELITGGNVNIGGFFIQESKKNLLLKSSSDKQIKKRQLRFKSSEHLRRRINNHAKKR
jgi:nucleoid DNA-binding protein